MAQGVVANAKHYVLNNQETQRQSVDVQVSAASPQPARFPPSPTECGPPAIRCPPSCFPTARPHLLPAVIRSPSAPVLSASGSTCAQIDERTLFELYLPPFEGAIDAGVRAPAPASAAAAAAPPSRYPRACTVRVRARLGPRVYIWRHTRATPGCLPPAQVGSIMCSYNKIGGRWSCESN